MNSFLNHLGLVALLGALCGCASLERDMTKTTTAANEPIGFLVRTNYQGWADSILVSNGRVEAIIVPAIGRVMQFRFAGENEGPFWENESLFGQNPDPASTNWLNFGGDKTWPAPQGEWAFITPRDWPPPAGFDAVPMQASIDGWKIKLVSPVDPYYGIRTIREISLALDEPVMNITTRYEKLEGLPLMASVWVITQLKEPLVACGRVANFSMYREGFRLMSEQSPPNLEVRDGILRLQRDPKTAHKVGMDVGSLLWVGEKEMLRIDSSRLPQQVYPDRGASAEIYTNPDPLRYVELEVLGPIHKMIPGTTIHRTSSYTLMRRTELDPELDVRKALLR
ncbi:MAG: hypothetical protein KJ072_11760 [Verrucomicrobia bacterium]|nr:hypothetical protein [Verrucomicrobiota bacterium]